MNKEISVPVWEKITLTITEAAALSNIGVNKISEMANNPRCPFVLYVGKKRLIKRKEFEKFVEKNIEI
jgi:excisionase family DNA binding protein